MPDLGRVRRRIAPQSVGQDLEARAARAVLARPDAASQLTTRRVIVTSWSMRWGVIACPTDSGPLRLRGRYRWQCSRPFRNRVSCRVAQRCKRESRSEEGRVGKAVVSTGRAWWAPDHYKKKSTRIK